VVEDQPDNRQIIRDMLSPQCLLTTGRAFLSAPNDPRASSRDPLSCLRFVAGGRATLLDEP
jgi:hypothetical protein